MSLRATIADTLVRNTIYNNLGYIVRVALAFFITPYIFHSLGKDLFGVWILSATIVGYFTLFDLGIGAAVVTFTAEHYVQGHLQEIRRLMTTALLSYTALSVVFLPVAIFPRLHGLLVDLFRVEEIHRADFVFVLGVTVLTFIFAFVFNVFQYVLRGLQRMDLTSGISIAMTVVSAVGTILVLTLGFGVRGLALFTLGIQVASVGAHGFVLRRFYPWATPALRLRLDGLRRFLAYGIKLQGASLCGLINFSFDKLLIGHSLGMALVGLYEIGSRIAGFIRELPILMLPAITPAASTLAAAGDRPGVLKLYLRSSRYLILLAAALASYVICLAPTLLRVWINPDNPADAVRTARILGVGYFFNIITGVGTAVGRGVAQPQYELRASAFTAALNILLSVTMLYTFGFIGLLIGTSAALTIGNLYYLFAFYRGYFKSEDGGELFRLFAHPLLASLPATTLLFFAQRVLLPSLADGQGGRLIGLLFLGLSVIVYSGVYCGGLWALGYIDRGDLDIFRRHRVGA
jgi:O-antigen/teichoic acid export membrane protein